MALKYWGKTISDYSAMRGPCPEGFHVPSYSETTSLKNVFKTSVSTADRNNYLKIPNAWYRYYNDWTVRSQWSDYWFLTTATSTETYWVWKAWGTITSPYKNIWYSLRPFKDAPVVPDNTWTVMYNDGDRIVSWSSTLWLISASADWTTWITITDKNLGATTVYNNWDTLSEANCGKYYQRWNNYWFPRTWSITTSSTKVDASWYWPWNYYSSSIFIVATSSSYVWDSSDNWNLRWWVTWVKQNPVDIVERYYWGKLIDDYSAMRWPCPEGFHVPKSSERSAIINAWVSLWARTTSWTTSVTNFRTYLKLPNIVYLFPGNWLPWTWWTPQHRYYWWCRQTWSDWSWRYCDALDVVEDYWWSIIVDNVSSNHWCPVRPFKDKPVIPDSTWTTLYASDVYPASRNIKHSQSLWLITISYDWTYITIADKNAGATSVYNFWDTITSANWWWLYQWWNNYPFSINWATTTSSNRVDTTWYGPWNYYSGSTFITGGVNDDWFSPRNRDLWWWITWIQQKPVKVTEVYYNTTKIWPKYSQIVIESDLTNSTLYSLQNDWWTNIYSSTGTYRLNNNGLAWPTEMNVAAVLYKDISEYIDEINKVKSLSLEFDAYGENDTYSGRVECWLRDAVTWSSVYSDIIMWYSSSSSYRYTTINWWPPATTNKTTVNRNWLYHIVFTYNMDTGVVSWNITQSGSSVYSKTYTIPESTRTQIKNNVKILYFSTNRWGNPAWDTTYIKNVKLVVNFN